MTPERLAEIREDLHFWIPSDSAGRESLNDLLAEVDRLRDQIGNVAEYILRLESPFDASSVYEVCDTIVKLLDIPT